MYSLLLPAVTEADEDGESPFRAFLFFSKCEFCAADFVENLDAAGSIADRVDNAEDEDEAEDEDVDESTGMDFTRLINFR